MITAAGSVLLRVLGWATSVNLRRATPWLIAIVAVAGGLWFFSHVRYQAGVTAEKARWEQAAAKAQAEADRKARDRQQQKDTAEAADSARRIEYRDRIVPVREEVIRYVAANPDSACIAAGDLGRMLDRAIDAANATVVADAAAARR